ncbi:MAG: hypothetical protein ABIO72_03145 [Patescibacteria group bacterium]
MNRSWIERLSRWFRKGPPSSVSFDPVSFERICREDPASARAALESDQRSLADELERTYAAYSERLESAAGRLAGMSDEDVAREARLLRESQDGLRRILRRIDASAHTARHLERELSDWESCGNTEGPRHADHPLVRAEIIRSELATRGEMQQIVAISPEQSPFRVVIERQAYTPADFEEPVSLPMADAEEEIPFETLASLDPDHLLGTIRLETREAERWHGHHDPDRDALDQVKQVRQLHAILKRIDREKGIRRDRTVYAIHMRDTR